MKNLNNEAYTKECVKLTDFKTTEFSLLSNARATTSFAVA